MATQDREQQLLRDAYAAGITNPAELANFMAQVGHESSGLGRLEERFNYTRDWQQVRDAVRSSMREGPEVLEAARIEALQGRPERLADLMYGGRMGNDAPGDGYRYRGRGYIQLTGKDQYEAAGEALELDLVNNPDLAAQPENASRIAIWYWQQNVPEAVRDDARLAGAAINGANPPNGLADREARFARWERDVTPELMQTLAEGRLGETVPPPRPAEPAPTPAPATEPARAASFDQAMQIMLPPQAGTAPHITSHYGASRSGGPHGGTDFNYVGGQNGINLEHPEVRSPISGVVTYGRDSGGGYGTVKIRDDQGYSHEILHLDSRSVSVGDRIDAGDPIGTMGGRGPNGPNQYAQHVHYQLRDPSGTPISPQRFWDEGRAHEGGGGVRPVTGGGGAELLRQDSRGESVRTLQESLDTLGIRDARGQALQADGIFGQRTDEAVRAFQQANGLKVDGIVGRDTNAALETALERQRAAEQAQPAAQAEPATARTSMLGSLFDAARSGDADKLKDALSGLGDTPIGRAFQSLQGERAAEIERNAGNDTRQQQDAQQQGCQHR